MVQQLGFPMLRYLSEITDEEKLHVRRGTIDLLANHMKMRFVAPGDWVRIKFDLQPLVRHACGDAYLTHRSSACFNNFSCTCVGVVLLMSVVFGSSCQLGSNTHSEFFKWTGRC